MLAVGDVGCDSGDEKHDAVGVLEGACDEEVVDAEVDAVVDAEDGVVEGALLHLFQRLTPMVAGCI